MINDRQPQDTEAKILQAAESEFLTKGFAGARTTSIAQAAGVTHAMFHYYFRTKDKLFERIISEKIALMKELLLDTVANSDMSLEEKIRNVIERHLDFVAANPNLPRFLVGEVFAYPERAKVLTEKIKQFAPRMIAKLQRQIDEAAANGIFRKVDAKMLIIDIVSLNIFSYMASPLINAVLDNCMEDSERFLAQRKKENFDTIMRKLKP
ncbi:MAG: TetR/AcrR family transcriptional regulator [Muribaculaceae bacterium]|nr:TetR/AcrR family transcriptional regulator [Muribaculaceae bacterium]